MKPDFNEISKIVKQIKLQDSAAFAKLYELTYQRLYFLAFSILKNEEDAKDAIQESFIKIYTSIHSLHNDKLFLAWANKIVYHICMRMHSKTTTDAVEDEVLQSIVDDNDERNPIKQVLVSEKQQALGVLIDKLSPELRATLIFKYYEGLKIQQIANIMNCPSGTVKSRLNNAKKQLKVSIHKENQGNIFYGLLPQLPLKQFFTDNAAYSGMDSSLAYDTMLQALAVSGISTAVKFHPQLPLASAQSNALISIGGAALGSIAVVTLGAVILSAPVVKDISILNKPEHFSNEDVIVSATIMPPLDMLSDVYAIGPSNTHIPITVSENGKADFIASRNGIFTVYAISKNSKTTSAEITVDCIDKTSPTINHYEYSDTEVVILVSDDLSGIDYDKLYGETEEAERIEPSSADQTTGTITFRFPEKPFRLFLSDLAGNLSTYNVKKVKK